MSLISETFKNQIINQYTDLFNYSPYLVYVHDLKGNILLANDITIRSLGYKKNHLFKLNLSDILNRRSLSVVNKMNKDIVNKDIFDFLIKSPVEFEIITHNKNKINIEAFSIPIKDKNDVKAILVIAKDIYKRIRTENKLKESEKKYLHLYENSPLCIIITNFEGTLIDLNFAALKFLNYDKEIVLYKNFIEMDEIPSIIKEKFKKFVNNSRNYSFIEDFKLIKEKNRALWVKGIFSKLKLDKEDYIQIILEDITEQKAHEEWRNNFIIRASHEIKSPLISICGGAEKVSETFNKTLESVKILKENISCTLKNILKDDIYHVVNQKLENIYHESGVNEKLKELDEFIKIYDMGARRMKSLTEELLNYASVESGTYMLNKKETNLLKTIEESINSYSFLIKERKLRLSQNLPNNLILNLDESKIRLVFENLLTNAIKYTPIGGKISVIVKNDDKLIINVQDTGIGLTKEEQEKIFEKFGKVNREGPNIISDGIGIGLYLSKNAVELHGGIISVESDGRDKGCNFIVEIPI